MSDCGEGSESPGEEGSVKGKSGCDEEEEIAGCEEEEAGCGDRGGCVGRCGVLSSKRTFLLIGEVVIPGSRSCLPVGCTSISCSGTGTGVEGLGGVVGCEGSGVEGGCISVSALRLAMSCGERVLSWTGGVEGCSSVVSRGTGTSTSSGGSGIALWSGSGPDGRRGDCVGSTGTGGCCGSCGG